MSFDEKFVDHVIEHYPVQTKMSAFDIGANVGKYSTKLAKKFDKVYAFEVCAETCTTLKETLKKAKTRNVEIINAGICDVDSDEVKMYSQSPDPKNRGGNTLSFFVAKAKKWGHDEKRFVPVKGITIDTFVKENKIDNLRFIKMDIEGGENFAWRGAEETLKNFELDIILEVHNCVHYDELFTFFNERKYKIFKPDSTLASRLEADTHYLITNRHNK